MPLQAIFSGRPLGSYAKVQALVGPLIRNRRFQLRRPRVRQGTCLDIGCGRNTHAELINLDYQWHPGVDVCWDITRGLPFAAASLEGVFTEHCLEHLPLPAVRALLQEIRRVLAPTGTLRVVVPDAELYLRTYVRQLDGDRSQAFPYQAAEEGQPLWSPLASVNRIFYQERESPSGHCVMFDETLLAALLRDSGFTRVSRRGFREGGNSRLLVDTPDRRSESLYIEASP